MGWVDRVIGNIPRWFACPEMVTNPTKWAQPSVTSVWHSDNGVMCQTTTQYFSYSVLLIALQYFLANVNWHSHLLYAIACPSVICNIHVSYSAGWNIPQCSYTIWYLGHLLMSTKNFMEIIPGEPLRRRGLNARGVANYSDFGLIEGYISEMVHCVSC